MNTFKIIRKQAQAGFTLIELIVVIVILGILAATALPRMFDMSGQARLAKIQAALGAVRAASASAHAQWLVNGGQLSCATCGAGGVAQPGTLVAAEGVNVVLLGGYPDVGGDGLLNGATVLGTTSGILVASGLTAPDYVLTTLNDAATPVAANNTFTVAADTAHPRCRFTYVEASQTAGSPTAQPVVTAPRFVVTDMTPENCS